MAEKELFIRTKHELNFFEFFIIYNVNLHEINSEFRLSTTKLQLNAHIYCLGVYI